MFGLDVAVAEWAVVVDVNFVLSRFCSPVIAVFQQIGIFITKRHYLETPKFSSQVTALVTSQE